VTVTPLSLVVARPLSGQLEVPWSAVKALSRVGEERQTLRLDHHDGERLLLQAHLFASREAFEALIDAIEGQLPPPRYDA
jgi:hypothetical protein